MIIIVLDNAIKFSQQNNEINIQLFSKDASAILKISDNGCGIAPDILPNIFDRFHKVNDERNKKGTGLGLAIAKQIAMRHNISIDVDSILDKGTTFTFTFNNISTI